MGSLLSISLLLASLCASLWSCQAGSYRKELRTKEVGQDAIIQLGRSMQFTRIDPSRVIQLSWRPRVFLYRDFLFDEECDHLIYLANEKLERSLASDSDSREAVTSSLNSSSGMATDISRDDTVARIEDRISTWSFLPKENGKPLKVLHYGIEETKQADDHNDDKSRLAVDEPVMATVVLYLSNVNQGGETTFPKSKFKSSYLRDSTWTDCAKTSFSVKPLKGNALLIFNLNPNTTPDVSSSYARCPVLEGEQWIATKSFHLRATQKNKSSSESDSTDCTDEEENCSQWAAIGECQRNPVYMIGSPDYYGSCRKSCKAC
ncbi:probable prolyl 4-hydroxylase 6 isoform X1 [Telopea speciosissima]|uniref:probable prolyl 4-hydroxylase 6 isoform X1 n=2 Tax=Telopea speciosissima TaxID=54955 RepID=UPI001CC5BF08|nr:probable prolyl 4-hydroxylase 6 isoform X1 [Telopea speciosissima]